MPECGFRRRMLPRAELGASLPELVILAFLVAVGLLGGVSAAQHATLRHRTEQTKKELRLIYRALMGDPAVDTFGFVGDLGELPARLEHLVVSGEYPAYTTSGHVLGVGMGWAGPYLAKTPEDVRLDEFGRAYSFDRDGDGQLRSSGADGLFGTRDDIVFPPSGSMCKGTLHVDVSGAGTAPVTVIVYGSSAGVESQRFASERPFVFEQVPLGLHVVEIRRGTGPESSQLSRKLVPLRDGSAFVAFRLPGERSEAPTP
ncbi:MAG: hypothetical protein HN742_36090 [Lentisphaerae bacterium]|nr:hypothetical protein [Lentisphaerota bacterium]MBT5605094.1 hypothetical protein [Lentisphaerota bacterium]MBT7060658.1 hypothetical protein [Lentisphaerota bacterium]MBT7847347.1 hypothetical protein [Lentisphaerota bacterium]